MIQMKDLKTNFVKNQTNCIVTNNIYGINKKIKSFHAKTTIGKEMLGRCLIKKADLAV